MSTLALLPRILRIAATAARYRLDDLVDDARVRRTLAILRIVLPSPSAAVLALPRGERFAIALTALGPIFVKFGQILSTRRDLLPSDIAEALTALQDRVAPFPGEQARTIIERELGAPI
ncbi:MAG: ubiquinone biosynthesis regulatory protein kinase UbiB, partial [Dokdonella sp.]